MYNDKMEQEIVDIVLSIPFDAWRYENSNGWIQTWFKKKVVVQMSGTKNPDGTSYATIHIEGISFRDESGERCKIFYNSIRKYLDAITEQKNLDKITVIYNHLKGINE